MMTAGGANTPMTAAIVRAGLNRYQESSYYNKDRKPMKMACVPEEALPPLNKKLLSVPGFTPRYQHVVRLSDLPLKECLSIYTSDEPVPLFLALSESLPNSAEKIPASLLDCLILQSGVKIDRRNSRLLATGRAGGLQAIDIAFKYFQATGKGFALIGGVDTCKFNLQRLSNLDREDRILAEGVMDGFAPGEAAGFLLLVSEEAQAKYRLPSHLTVYQSGFGTEAGHRYSNEPYKGDGLAEAFQNAIAQRPHVPIDVIYSSMNGENHWAKEYGVAMTRNNNVFADNIKLEHPADCIGDIGAAFGPVLLGIMSKNITGTGLAYCSSDGLYRSAVCVEK